MKNRTDNMTTPLAAFRKSTVFLAVVCLSVMLCLGGGGVSWSQDLTVKALSGISERFNRLVFNWPFTVKYDSKTVDGHVTITFEKEAKINFSSVDFTAMPFVKGMQQRVADGKTTLIFDIPVDAQVQSFTTGTKVVFDVLKNSQVPVQYAAKAVKDSPREQKLKQDIETARAKAETEKLPPKAEEPPKPEEKKTPEIIEQAETPPAVSATPSEPEKPAVAFEETPREEPPVKPVQGNNTEQEAPPVAPAVPIPQADKTPSNEETAFPRSSFTVRPVERARMAVFQRGGYLWIVLDRKMSDVPPEMTGGLVDKLKPVMRVEALGGTAYRLNWPFAKDEVHVVTVRDNLAWTVEFVPDKGAYVDIMPEIDYATTPDKPAIVLRTVEKPGKVLVKDPEIGDQLFVVTVFNDKIKSPANNRYPEFRMVPALLGAVVKPLNEDVIMETVDDGVRVIGKDRLVLSDESDLRARASKENLRPNRRMFDLVGWQAGSQEYFLRNRRMMETHIIHLEGAAKAAGYVDLAKLLVANGLGAEALGALTLASELLPDMEKSPDFRAIRGAANALFFNPDKAIEDLNFEPLKNQPEALLWLGYTYSSVNKWQQAAEYFDKVNPEILATYPDRIRIRMLEAQVISYIETDAIPKAAEVLAILNAMPSLYTSDKAAYNYMSGRVLAMTGDFEGAEKMLKAAMSLKDRFYGVQARYDYINALYKQEKIDAAEAIKRFESIRFSWRGDELEIKNLHRLGQLYIDNNEYAEGLSVLREATILSKDNRHKDAITADMVSAFANLYVEGKSDELSPIEALSVFNEFKELLPAGHDGIVALKRLAERMVAVDLLKQASDLYEKLIRYHVSGQEATEMGARLAIIRLRDFKPKMALQALDETQPSADTVTDTSEWKTVMDERQLLRTRGLSDMGKIDEALTLIQDRGDYTALGLRADINWRAGRWAEAAKSLEDLIDYDLKHPEKDDMESMKQQNDRVVEFVLKRGIALALTNNQKELNNLYADYHTLMEGTDVEAAFNVVVRVPQSGSLADIRTLKSRVKEVDLFDSFLKNYKISAPEVNTAPSGEDKKAEDASAQPEEPLQSPEQTEEKPAAEAPTAGQ